jgi:hypothetical protein
VDSQLGVWRRFGDAVYATVVIIAFGLQIAAMAFVTLALIGNSTGASIDIEMVVTGAISMVALAVFMLVVYVLAHHAIGSSREDAGRRRKAFWTERWLGVLFGVEPPPDGKLSPAAQSALIDIAETVTGPEALAVRKLLVDRGVQERLTADLSRRRMAVRLEALESLAKARLPGVLPALFRGMDLSSHKAIRALSTRAAARTLGAMPPGAERRHLAVSFAEALAGSDLPPGVVEEAILLAEEAGTPAARYLLVRPGLCERALRATLDAVGRSMSRELAGAVVAHGRQENPEIRAAALRSLGRLHVLPEGAEKLIIRSLGDTESFVRVQATRTLKLIRPQLAEKYLVCLLGDESWWVRKAAAEGLLDLGTAGTDALVEAAASHVDRYARDMAAQVLRDHSSKTKRSDAEVAA